MEEHSHTGTQTFSAAALALMVVGVALLALACVKATTYSFHVMGLVIFLAIVAFFLAVKVWQPVDHVKR